MLKGSANKVKRLTEPGRFDIARSFRWVLVLILFLITFSALDQLAHMLQLFPGVVAWYPPDGLSLAFLLTFGVGFTPVFTIASLISSLIIYHFSTPLGPILAWAVILSAIYGIEALILLRVVRIDPELKDMRDTLWLILTSAVATTILAVVSVSGLIHYGEVPAAVYFNAVAEWWIGEMTGVVVFTPCLIVYGMPWVRRFINGERTNSRKQFVFRRPSLQSIGQVISIPVILYIAFGIPALGSFEPYFLIAGPLIWIALENGFSKVSLAIVGMNFGTMLAIWLFKVDATHLGELQFLTLGIYASALLTGAIITKQKRTQEELRQSEVRNRALIENAPDAIVLLGADGLLKYFSPSAERILGYAPEEMIGHNPGEFTHPDDRTARIKILDDLGQEPGKIITTQYRFRHKDGSWRWLESTITNLLAEPSVQAIVFNFRDITERRQAEREIVRLAKFPSENPSPVLRLSQDGLVMYANKASEAFLNMWGCEVGGSVPEFWLDLANHALATKENKTVDIEWEGKVTSMIVTPIAEEGYVNVYGRDVTERKQAEKALQESEYIFRSFLEQSEDAIMLSNNQGMLIQWSKGAEKLTGFSREESLGHTIWDIQYRSAPDNFKSTEIYEHMKAALQAALLTGKGVLFSNLVEAEIQRPDGTRKTTQSLAFPVQTDKGFLLGSILRDITERKKAEEEIKIINDELSMLFELSHSLAEADKLDDILDLVDRHAVESIHTTFARIALFEGGNYIIRAAYPVRAIGNDFGIGERYPVNSISSSPHILEQNEPIILRGSDPGISNEEKKVLLLDFAQSLCLIPLRISDSTPNSENLIGLLMLGETRNEGREPFTPEKMRLARTIGDSAAIAIRRMLLREQTERRLQELVALSKIDLAIISSSDMVFSLGVLLSQAKKQLKVDAADIWRFNPALQALEFVTGSGFRTPAFENAKPLRIGEGMVGQAAIERRTIHIPDLTVNNVHPLLREAFVKEPFISYYAVPLIVKGEVKGVLELFHRSELEANEEWMEFLHTLANQAAIAIDNSSLFKDLQDSNTELTQAYDATILGWSRALDLRDNETEGHTQRVAEMTTRLGRLFGLSEEDLVQARWGALLHDIGKMGVPDGILLKPGPLTDEEWVVMRKHTTFAFELLSPIHFLRTAVNIPYCHHEKWDGSGYPRGLKGEAIPLPARIFALVDVYDALTSDRPYRKAWPEEKVLEHIRSLSGTHFDPQVVKICLEPGLLKGQSKRRIGMKPVQWTEKFSVGVKELDQQHQQLIKLLNRLISAQGTINAHSETISDILLAMTRYAKTHFKTEERLMKAYGYPGLEEQKKQHRDFRKKTVGFSTATTLGVDQISEDLLKFLSDWLVHHILEDDMAYRSFFIDKGVE